jgi:hypothetical protein
MKISLSILLIGLIVIGIYWFIPQEKNSLSLHTNDDLSSESKETIILPSEMIDYRQIPEVKAYLSELKQLIEEGKAVLPLPENELDARGIKVQDLLLKDPHFLEDTKQGNTLLHNDMMRIVPALVSTLDAQSKQVCAHHICYQAEKYNFVTNTTTRAIVDTDAMKVLSVERYPNMQPDISLRLTRIAQAIALAAPEVKKALGKEPRKSEMSMANVRGTMKESPCEDTTHLCVAPTFADHKRERALWAVVDLTDLRLAAAKWAGLGKTTTPACISERRLQNRFIMENFCKKETLLKRDGWEISYSLTGSDGLEVRHARYKGRPVFRSAKIVDWHVSYQQEGGEKLDTDTESYIEGRRVEFVRGEDGHYLFGYNDAMGCPMFSTSVVLPFNGPQVKSLKTQKGFMLTQDYRNPKWPMACNYRYENRFEFYADGSFRIVGVNKGRGCGDNAIYRPVMRIDTTAGEKERFYSEDNGSWRLWEKEGSEQIGMGGKKGYPYKIVSSEDPERGYYIEPNHGQFGDGSRGDHATIFVTKFKENEGDRDLLTLGSCCDLSDDGVERYIADEESIKDEDIVIWYVPRIRNDAREGHEYCWADTVIGDDGNLHVQVWPCTVGPKFIPLRGMR